MTRTTPSIPKDKRHGIFKKDRKCQLHRNDRSHSLEYRRLRFSFHINHFKDQTRETRATLLNAGVRRRRGFSRLGRSSQEVSWKKLSGPSRPQGRRRRLPEEIRSPSQPGFSANPQIGNRSFQATENRREKREASLFYRFRRFDWSAETIESWPRTQGI